MARPVDSSLLLLTPRGVGGVAVVALAGAERAQVAAAILGDARAPGASVEAVPRLRWLWLGGEAIDQVLAFERVEHHWIELHLHASEAVLQRLEAELGPATTPAVTACVSWMRDARGHGQLGCALEQQALLAPWGGDFAAWLAAHRHDPAALTGGLARSAVALALRHPCTLVLCGRKNAGKSTLMNRLLFHERVLTGPEPGLTRDPVGEVALLDGYPYELVDTAGEGDAIDAVDARAMALGRAARSGAWRLVVIDAARAAGEVETRLLAESARSVIVATKADLPAAAWRAELPPPEVRVSCVDPRDAAGVRAAVGTLLRCRRGLPSAGRLGGVAALTEAQLDGLRDAASA